MTSASELSTREAGYEVGLAPFVELVTVEPDCAQQLVFRIGTSPQPASATPRKLIRILM